MVIIYKRVIHIPENFNIILQSLRSHNSSQLYLQRDEQNQ